MTTSFILNGQSHGKVAERLLASGFDHNVLRPFIGDDGRTYLNMNQGYDDNGEPIIKAFVTNAPATLRHRDWTMLDAAVIRAAKPRLNAVGDLRSRGLVLNLPNGMAKTSLEHQTVSDITPAVVSMDGISRSETDSVQYGLENLPLPIISNDFSMAAREIAVSRNSNTPLDTTAAELAGRRVAEEAESLLMGTSSEFKYGGGAVYGYLNYPNRLTKTLTAPTSINHKTTVDEVLAMRKQSTDANYYGPWTLYYSPAWYSFMDEDYINTEYSGMTLRKRLLQIEGIEAVRPADYMTGTTLLLVQNTPDVARLVMGMDITTVQWETQGGMEFNFKVMAIMVPQLRSDYNGATGIVHGSV